MLVPGLGLFGLGATAKDARIAADLAEAAIDGITDAEAIGRFKSIPEADMFDMRILVARTGQARRAQERLPLAGQIAVITGAGGAIGAATAKRLPRPARKSPCSTSISKPPREQAKAIGGAAIGARLRRHR